MNTHHPDELKAKAQATVTTELVMVRPWLSDRKDHTAAMYLPSGCLRPPVPQTRRACLGSQWDRPKVKAFSCSHSRRSEMPKSQRGQCLLNLRSCSGFWEGPPCRRQGSVPIPAQRLLILPRSRQRKSFFKKHATSSSSGGSPGCSQEAQTRAGERSGTVCSTGNEAPCRGAAEGNRRGRGSRAGKSRPGRAGRASGKR